VFILVGKAPITLKTSPNDRFFRASMFTIIALNSNGLEIELLMYIYHINYNHHHHHHVIIHDFVDDSDVVDDNDVMIEIM
jgi:hypothetical protein